MKVNLIMYFTKRLNAVGTDIMGNEKFDSPQKPLVETKITYGLRTVKNPLRK
jgi:hypothetical protein